MLTHYSGPSKDASTALFVVRTSKVLECTQCHTERQRPAPTDNYELHLSFPSVQAKHFSLKRLLKHNLSSEVILRCDDCPPEKRNDPDNLGDWRQGEAFDEQTKIVHFPELLCMTLNMYEHNSEGELERIKHSVDIPLDLDLSSRSDVKAKKGSIMYKLSAVIKHRGESPSEGHYICYSRMPKTTDWYLCNDGKYKKSDFKRATKFSSREIPYLLFFERIYDVRARGSKETYDAKEYAKPSWWEDGKASLKPPQESKRSETDAQTISSDSSDSDESDEEV